MGGQMLGVDEAGFSVIASSPEPVWSLGFAFESLSHSRLGSWHFATHGINKHVRSQARIATNLPTPNIGHA